MPMRFGPYLLRECIGAGGMAAVYKGRRRDPSGFETPVVVKALLPEHRRNPSYVRMFKEEARLSAQLTHANVVRVHGFGAVGDTPYLEMEDLSGWNLEQVWSALASRGRRLPVAIALTLIAEACRGLAYVHGFVDDAGVRRPIIHRDVSPANVMICRDGSVKLVDFGLARETRGETIEIDTFLGKLAYMSPEQLDRRQLDRRADVFALGVTLHELLTGQRLFAADNNVATLQRLQTLIVEPPSRVNPEVPAALDVIVLRALERDPGRRYQSAGEMLAALDGLGPRHGGARAAAGVSRRHRARRVRAHLRRLRREGGVGRRVRELPDARRRRRAVRRRGTVRRRRAERAGGAGAAAAAAGAAAPARLAAPSLDPLHADVARLVAARRRVARRRARYWQSARTRPTAWNESFSEKRVSSMVAPAPPPTTRRPSPSSR